MFPGEQGIYFSAVMSLGAGAAEEFYGFSVTKK